MSADQSAPKEAGARLLVYLRRLKSDRGAMADLRCGLSPSSAKRARAWPLLARVGGIDNARIETVAGLFAYHPKETSTGNLGTTCKWLAAENNSFDARFQRLLACDWDEIWERVRPVVLAAKPKGIPVNYEGLYVDLYYWGDKVKARWAREYWVVPEGEEPAAVAASEATP